MGQGIPDAPASDNFEARLGAIDDVFAAGLAALASVTRVDRALSTQDKATLLVAAAAVRDRSAVAFETERAVGLGVGQDRLRSLALALYLSRGGGPARALLDQLQPLDSASKTSPVPAPSVTAMVNEFGAIFGEIPDRIALLADSCPAGLTAYHLMRRAVLTTGTLEPIVAELALMCVNAAEHRADFAAVHAAGARKVGATDDQLIEAGLCAISSGGVAAWLAAAEAIVVTRPSST